LQLVTRDSREKLNNIVIKSSLRLNRSNPNISELCFLKTCHLCNKQLHQDKDVYMYRGDLGFCSRECRESQMLIDDRKELEASTKMMLASYRRCNNGAGKSESRNLFDDLRRRRQLFIVPWGFFKQYLIIVFLVTHLMKVISKRKRIKLYLRLSFFKILNVNWTVYVVISFSGGLITDLVKMLIN
jgi:hypothetical protein